MNHQIIQPNLQTNSEPQPDGSFEENQVGKKEPWFMNKKLIIISIIVGVFVIAGLSIAGYYCKDIFFGTEGEEQIIKEENLENQGNKFSTNSEKVKETDIAGWKIYKDEVYGFEIQVPNTYSSFEKLSGYQSGRRNTIFILVAEDDQNSLHLSLSISPIDVYEDRNTGGSFTFYDLENGKCEGEYIEYNENYHKFIFEGLEGCYIGDADGPGGSVGYLIPNGKNNQIIEIVISYGGEEVLNDEMALRDLNNVISTFKFLPNKTDWVTYTNNQQGYEIKYPASWNDGLEVKYEGDQTLFYLPAYNNRKAQAFCIGRKAIVQWEDDYQKFLKGERPAEDEIKRNNEHVFYRCPHFEAETFTVAPNPYDTDILATFKFN